MILWRERASVFKLLLFSDPGCSLYYYSPPPLLSEFIIFIVNNKSFLYFLLICFQIFDLTHCIIYIYIYSIYLFIFLSHLLIYWFTFNGEIHRTAYMDISNYSPPVLQTTQLLKFKIRTSLFLVGLGPVGVGFLSYYMRMNGFLYLATKMLLLF